MPVLGAPAIFLAGVLGALVPLGLHLLRRRPDAPQALPTARFLTPDPRSRIRLSAPDRPLLLALRMLLPILAGAALAQPGWVPRLSGRGEIVLIDRAGASSPERLARAMAQLRGGAAGEPVVTVLFDSSGAEIMEGLPRSTAVRRGSAVSPLLPGLDAVPTAARALRGVDSIRLTVVAPLRASSWTPGAGAIRSAVWPGSIRVLEVGADSARTQPEPPTSEVSLLTAIAGGYFLRTALEASGARITEGAGIVYAARPASPAELARRTVIMDATALGATPRELPGTLSVDGSPPLSAVFQRAPLRLSIGETLVGAWEDGTAAVAVRRGAGECRVRFGAALEGGTLPYRAGYPRLLSNLARSCAAMPARDGPLDAGARAHLAGSGAEWVSARSADASLPIPLGRWLMIMALIIAMAETLLSRRADRERA